MNTDASSAYTQQRDNEMDLLLCVRVRACECICAS